MFNKINFFLKNSIFLRFKYFISVYIPKSLKNIKNSKPNLSMLIIILAIVSILAVFFTTFNTIFFTKNKKTIEFEISYNDFIQEIQNNNIDYIFGYSQSNPKISGKLKNSDSIFTTDNPQSQDFKKYLLESGIRIIDKPFTQNLHNAVWPIISLIIQLIIIIFSISFLYGFLIKKQTNSGMSSKFQVVQNCDITFEQVAGNEEAKENMMELVDFLINTEKYKKLGVTPPKGTVLYGPPGTGKTLLAKALAGTAKVPYIAVSGSDFVEKYVGVGAARIRELFKNARKMNPCIIFIDEIDALGKRGGDGLSSSDEKDRTLNQLLVEIDGFSGSEGIIVIAATNRLDMLDPALLRSGRFDRQIQVSLPDINARYSILKVHTKNKSLSNDVDLHEIAKMTAYMSGADLKNVMNEAGIYAIRDNRTQITMQDIDKAISKIHAGEEKKNKSNITEKDKKITAYHEAGHVIISKLLSGATASKVSIIPTTKGAGGYTLYSPKEKMYASKKDLLDKIAILLAGRASEELIFGENEVTTGASLDIKQATQIAREMVKSYGMSKNIGIIYIGDSPSINSSNCSSIECEVKEIINSVYEKTKDLLKENSNILENLAITLLEKETMYRKEIDNIIENSMFDKILK